MYFWRKRFVWPLLVLAGGLILPLGPLGVTVIGETTTASALSSSTSTQHAAINQAIYQPELTGLLAKQISSDRVARGLSPYRDSYQLYRAASDYSRFMAETGTYKEQSDSEAANWVARYYKRPVIKTGGFNVGMSYKCSPAGVYEIHKKMVAEGLGRGREHVHYRNLFSNQFRDFGVSVWSNSNRTAIYVTEYFVGYDGPGPTEYWGSPKSPVTEPCSVQKRLS